MSFYTGHQRQNGEGSPHRKRGEHPGDRSPSHSGRPPRCLAPRLWKKCSGEQDSPGQAPYRGVSGVDGGAVAGKNVPQLPEVEDQDSSRPSPVPRGTTRSSRK